MKRHSEQRRDEIWLGFSPADNPPHWKTTRTGTPTHAGVPCFVTRKEVEAVAVALQKRGMKSKAMQKILKRGWAEEWDDANHVAGV